MDFFRVGDKLLDVKKANRAVEKIFALRSQGLSQQEVAARLHLDRAFISRLETLGEVRRGEKLGLLGFPLQNKEELAQIAEKAGVDFALLMTEKERWQFAQERSGMEFFNEVMQIVSRLRECDTIIVLGSSKWIELAEVLFDNQVLYIEIGDTPIKEDIYLEPDRLESLLQKVLGKESK